jgi:ABC-type transport system involved in multi-copper enzyme maturation permease subunit
MKVIRLISLGSICCIALAVTCEIPYSLLLFCNIYSDGLLVTGLYLFGAGFVLGIISLFIILIARTYWWGLIPAIVSILIGGSVVWINFQIAMHVQRRHEILKNEIGDYNLKLLADELIKYAGVNSGCLPSAENWCDLLMKQNIELTKNNFTHPKPHIYELKGECHFAFNSNLGGMKLADIAKDTVLLFEADGAWNLNGTEELLKTRYDENGYIAILTIDGKMWKYWFYKNALRKFDSKGKHMYYEQPRWKP